MAYEPHRIGTGGLQEFGFVLTEDAQRLQGTPLAQWAAPPESLRSGGGSRDSQRNEFWDESVPVFRRHAMRLSSKASASENEWQAVYSCFCSDVLEMAQQQQAQQIQPQQHACAQQQPPTSPQAMLHRPTPHKLSGELFVRRSHTPVQQQWPLQPTLHAQQAPIPHVLLPRSLRAAVHELVQTKTLSSPDLVFGVLLNNGGPSSRSASPALQTQHGCHHAPNAGSRPRYWSKAVLAEGFGSPWACAEFRPAAPLEDPESTYEFARNQAALYAALILWIQGLQCVPSLAVVGRSVLPLVVVSNPSAQRKCTVVSLGWLDVIDETEQFVSWLVRFAEYGSKLVACGVLVVLEEPTRAGSCAPNAEVPDECPFCQAGHGVSAYYTYTWRCPPKILGENSKIVLDAVPPDGRSVCVKVMPLKLEHYGECEIEILLKLRDCQYVVQLIDYFLDPLCQICIVTPLLEPLDPPVSEVIVYFKQLMVALTHLERLQIVHHDITRNNVMKIPGRQSFEGDVWASARVALRWIFGRVPESVSEATLKDLDPRLSKALLLALKGARANAVLAVLG
eukprot:m51a1_g340 hypothetical protein (564) ;mRNA; f:524567-526667